MFDVQCSMFSFLPMNDLKFAFRQLLKNPGFTAVAVLTLALGIGANTAIFSVVNAVLLKPLPYPDPGQLVQLRKQARSGNRDAMIGGGNLIGGVEFVAFKTQSRSLSRIAAYAGGDMNLTGLDQAERVACGEATSDFFPLLGIRPLLGRNFTKEEDTPNGPPAAILGHGIWQSRFGGDRGVIGRTITLNKRSYTIIGVLPADFQFPQPFQLWIPLALDEANAGPGIRLLEVIARLKPGLTPVRAQTELQTIAQRMQPPQPGIVGQASRLPGQDSGIVGPASDSFERLAPPVRAGETPPLPLGALEIGPGGPVLEPEQGLASRPLPIPGPSSDAGTPGGAGPVMIQFDAGVPLPFGGDAGVVTLVALHEQIAGPVKRALWVLLGAVGFVLLIACANVANLLLARAAARQREMAVRAALGAGRWRVVRQLLTESVLLSLAGGGFGLLLAFWGVAALARLSGASLPTMHGIQIDAWVLAFTLGVSAITGLAFGLAPAFQVSRVDMNAVLKEAGYSDTGGYRNRFRHLLVVSEVALALVLLISAGLLIKSFARLRQVNPGFRTEGVLTMQVRLAEERFGAAQQKVNFVEQLLERLKALPGVQAAAATDHLPLTHYAMMTLMNVEGRLPQPAQGLGKEPPVSIASVTPDYFSAMGIAVKAGRAFTSRDPRGGAGIALVNEAFAKHYFPGESAIGKRIADVGTAGGWLTIEGVVEDVRQSGLESEVTPEVYRAQTKGGGELLSFVIRTTRAPTSLASAVRAAVAEVDRNQPVFNLMTMGERLASTMTSRRLNVILLGGFAAVALLLAVVGIYGVMSYAVTQRRRELGVRQALGAQKSDVLGIVLSEGLRLTVAGVLIGLVVALALTRYLSSLLYSVKATDPLTFLAVALALSGVALFACYVPARRATKTDPMQALRHE
jgi:cell division protein FtsX